MAHDRNKLVGLAKRLLNHNLNGSTDQADEIMVKPVNDYIDDDIIRSEVDKSLVPGSELVNKDHPQVIEV